MPTQRRRSDLLAHLDVTGVVVIATEGARRLVAFVTPSSTSSAGLLEHLKAKLPDYMVPDRIVAMEAFPLSANGKVDRPTLARDQA